MNFLWFSIIAYGMTQIIVYGKIFEKIRPTQGWLGQLLSCPMCTGFWVGVFLWCVKAQTQLFIFDDSYATAFLLGCAGSATSYIGCTIFGDDGLMIFKTVNIFDKRRENETIN